MASLTESQRNAIRIAFQVLHERMAEVEGLIATVGTPSPLSQYVSDLAPTEVKVVCDYFSRIRGVMLADLKEEGIPLNAPRTSLRWAVTCGLMSLSVMVDEMGPRKLANYGALDAEGRARAERVQGDVRRLVERLEAYIRQGQGRDLADRLARLEYGSGGSGMLTTLERIISRWRLLEFRPLLDMIVSRIESPSYEVAVFGRVSSGKSSLLNYLAGQDILPVGVTPITAVPTRLRGGESPSAIVSFAELPSRTIALGELWRYASERGNPGNTQHVTAITVTFPSSRLPSGVTFVDTPGIGSLASAGGAETLAYLPRADLGVVLVDAASTLNEEDLSLLKALYAAGIPSMVLLSKADLISGEDRGRLIGYMKEQFLRELGVEVSVHPVSTVGAGQAFLKSWFEEGLKPLLAEHRSLAESSLRRKVGQLRESVVAVLEMQLARCSGASTGTSPADVAEVKGCLIDADARVRVARGRLNQLRDETGYVVSMLPRRIARALTEAPVRDPGLIIPGETERVLRERARDTLSLVLELKESLQAALIECSKRSNASFELVEHVVGGLPTPELTGLIRAAGIVAVPRWAFLVSRIGCWLTERRLRDGLSGELEEAVRLYDSRLHAWARENLSQVVGLYEDQADAVREQLRRYSSEGDEDGSRIDRGELERSLAELAGE